MTPSKQDSPINKATVQHVAILARLDLTEAELERYTTDLSNIMDLMAQLNELDLDAVDMTVTAADLEKLPTVYRPDGQTLDFDKERVFKNAPHEEDHCFRVPKILDDASTKKSEVTTHA